MRAGARHHLVVYQVLAVQIGSELERIGFEVRICRVRSVPHGILGGNGIVIVARKPAPGR